MFLVLAVHREIHITLSAANSRFSPLFNQCFSKPVGHRENTQVFTPSSHRKYIVCLNLIAPCALRINSKALDLRTAKVKKDTKVVFLNVTYTFRLPWHI